MKIKGLFYFFIFLVLSAIIFLNNTLHTVNAETQTFTNPLMTGADPHMFYKDGYYYFVKTEGSKITVWKTESPVDLKYAKPVQVWTAPTGTMYCCNVWAPEIHYIGNRWYIYFAADNGDDHYHRMYVLESQTQDAQGPYTFKGKIAPPNAPNAWAIDGTVFRHTDGKLYFVWSGRPGTDLTAWQQIYIAPMSNPYTISGNRVSIVQATYSWEKKGWDGITFGIVEAPAVLQRNGKTFITYSASFFATPDYALGMIANSDGKVLNPSSWSKRSSPVFKQTDGVYGVGHNAFTKSPDGTEDWIIYHARNTTSSSERRTVRAQKFTWGSTGAPIFGTPIKAGVEIPLPSGDSYGDLVVEKFSLIDGNGIEKTNFAPGETIYPRVTIRNTGYRPVRVLNGTMISPILSHAPEAIIKNTQSDIGIYLKFNEILGNSTATFDANPLSQNRTSFSNTAGWSMIAEGNYSARIYLNNTHEGKEINYNNNQEIINYIITSSQVPISITITTSPTASPTPKLSITPTLNFTPTPQISKNIFTVTSYPRVSGLTYPTYSKSKRTLIKINTPITLEKIECYKCGSNSRIIIYQSDSSGIFGQELTQMSVLENKDGWFYANLNQPLMINNYYIIRVDSVNTPTNYGTTAMSYNDLIFIKYSTSEKPTWQIGSDYIRITYSK